MAIASLLILDHTIFPILDYGCLSCVSVSAVSKCIFHVYMDVRFTFLFVTLLYLIFFSLCMYCTYTRHVSSAMTLLEHIYTPNKDQQPRSVMLPLSSSPYQQPCVSAVSYRTHTSYGGRHQQLRFEGILTEEWRRD